MGGGQSPVPFEDHGLSMGYAVVRSGCGRQGQWCRRESEEGGVAVVSKQVEGEVEEAGKNEEGGNKKGELERRI